MSKQLGTTLFVPAAVATPAVHYPTPGWAAGRQFRAGQRVDPSHLPIHPPTRSLAHSFIHSFTLSPPSPGRLWLCK